MPAAAPVAPQIKNPPRARGHRHKGILAHSHSGKGMNEDSTGPLMTTAYLSPSSSGRSFHGEAWMNDGTLQSLELLAETESISESGHCLGVARPHPRLLPCPRPASLGDQDLLHEL